MKLTQLNMFEDRRPILEVLKPIYKKRGKYIIKDGKNE